MSSDQIQIGYSANDFFYAEADNFNVDGSFNLKPTDSECKVFLSQNWEDDNCNAYFSDNSINCIKYQLCKNKTTIGDVVSNDNKYAESIEKNFNSNDDFKNTILNTMNLTIGIGFIFFVIYKLQDMQKKKKLNPT